MIKIYIYTYKILYTSVEDQREENDGIMKQKYLKFNQGNRNQGTHFPQLW